MSRGQERGEGGGRSGEAAVKDQEEDMASFSAREGGGGLNLRTQPLTPQSKPTVYSLIFSFPFSSSGDKGELLFRSLTSVLMCLGVSHLYYGSRVPSSFPWTEASQSPGEQEGFTRLETSTAQEQGPHISGGHLFFLLLFQASGNHCWTAAREVPELWQSSLTAV